MTTVNSTGAVWCEGIKIILFFLSNWQKVYFVVCHRILVISLCVPWDEKGWKWLVYSKASWQSLGGHWCLEDVVSKVYSLGQQQGPGWSETRLSNYLSFLPSRSQASSHFLTSLSPLFGPLSMDYHSPGSSWKSSTPGCWYLGILCFCHTIVCIRGVNPDRAEGLPQTVDLTH